ncbi:MAG: MFS transporter [Pseudomonadota bacterium]
MSFLNAFRLSRAPSAALMGVGVLWGSFAGLAPDIKAQVGVSDAGFASALLFSAGSGLIAMALAPWVGQHLGQRALAVLGTLVSAVILTPALPSGFVGLACVMAGLGFAVALLDVSANVQISRAEARHDVPLMNFCHAMFSFAFAAAAGFCGLARKAGLGPAEIVPFMALAALACAVLMRNPSDPEPPRNAEKPSVSGSSAPWLAIGLTGIVLWASFIGENAVEAWSALHVERTLGGATGIGSFGPALLGVFMGCARLSAQVITERVGAARLIFGSACLGLAGTLTIAAAPSVVVAMIGVGLTGVGMAAVVPSANTLLGQRVAEAQRAHAISRAWMLGITGFFVGPALMGAISEWIGLRWAFGAIALIIGSILPATAFLARQPRLQPHKAAAPVGDATGAPK